MRFLRPILLLAFLAVLAGCGRVADTATTSTQASPTTEAEPQSPARTPSTATHRAQGNATPPDIEAATPDPTPDKEAAVGDELAATPVPADTIVPATDQGGAEDEAAVDDPASTSTPSPADAPGVTDPSNDEASIADLDVAPSAELADTNSVSPSTDETAAPTTTVPAAASPSIETTTTTGAPDTTTTGAPSTTTVPTTSSSTTSTPSTTIAAAAASETPSPTTTTTTAVVAKAAASTSTTAPAATAVRPANLPTTPAEVALVVVEEINVYPTSTSGGAEWTFGRATQFGNPTVFLIAGREGTRLKVLLPIRQKHTYGWIDAADVTISSTDLRAVISLSNRDVSLYRGNERLSASTAVIGKASTPTPVGSFFVTDKLRHANPAGGYGPWIVALSARSEALTTFNGGEPLIAIHGTNKPWLVGGKHSNGCIRLPNDAITALAQLVPLGTPVDIVA